MLFHLGTAIAMCVGEFPFVSIAGWMAFVPHTVWARLPLLPPREPIPRSRLGVAFSELGGLGLLVMLLYQDTLELSRGALTPSVFEQHFNALTGFKQNWWMFAGPGTNDGWPVVAGTFADGAKLDLFRGKPLSFDRPQPVSSVYPNDRWRTYFFRINDNYAGDHRAYYAGYLCRLWNEPPGGRNRLLWVELIYMKVTTISEGTLAVGESAPERIYRYVTRCP
jgi:hypothetical protein